MCNKIKPGQNRITDDIPLPLVQFAHRRGILKPPLITSLLAVAGCSWMLLETFWFHASLLNYECCISHLRIWYSVCGIQVRDSAAAVTVTRVFGSQVCVGLFLVIPQLLEQDELCGCHGCRAWLIAQVALVCGRYTVQLSRSCVLGSGFALGMFHQTSAAHWLGAVLSSGWLLQLMVVAACISVFNVLLQMWIEAEFKETESKPSVTQCCRCWAPL